MSDDIEITPPKDNVVSFSDFAKRSHSDTPKESGPQDAGIQKPQIKLPKHGDLNHQLKEVIKTMTPVERKIVTLRFGIDDGQKRTKKEVSAMLNVPVEKVSEAENKAMAILNDLQGGDDA